MRPLFFALIFIIVPSSFIAAQQLVLGINAGVAANGIFTNKDHVFTKDAPYSKTGFNPTGSFKAGVSKKKVEFGLMVSAFKFSYPVDARYNQGPIGFEPWFYPFDGYDEFVCADKAVSIQFYVNRKIKIANVEAYYGLAIGRGKFFLDKPGESTEDRFSPYDNWPTFNLSAQLGGTYYFNKHLGINVEVAGNYIVPFNLKADRYLHLYSIPATAGIRYKIL